jgi:hypothetical protein
MRNLGVGGKAGARRLFDIIELAGGADRARSHCRFVLPLIHFIPDLRTYSPPLFLKRQCDRTLGAELFGEVLERTDARLTPGPGPLGAVKCP